MSKELQNLWFVPLMLVILPFMYTFLITYFGESKVTRIKHRIKFTRWANKIWYYVVDL